MKRARLIFCVALLATLAAFAVSVGDVVDFEGTINDLDAQAKIIAVNGVKLNVEPVSMLVINGKKVSFGDLAVGMTVNGSAQITRVDVKKQPNGSFPQVGPAVPDRSVRFLTVTGKGIPPLPAYAPSRTEGQSADAQALRQKLGGTFWASRRRFITQGMPVDQAPISQNSNHWFELNADGTVTSASSPTHGAWVVDGALLVIVNFSGSPEASPVVLKFNSDLTQAEYYDYQKMYPMDLFTAVRIAGAPTQDPIAGASGTPPGVTPAASASPAAASSTPSPDNQAAAAEAIRVNHGNLVFVTGKEGAGSGFIANINNTSFLVTNAHVAAGINNADFKTLDGTTVKGDAASVAIGEDIFCIALPQNVAKPLEIMQGVDSNAKIGDDVVVLGNAGGSGVVNSIIGKIVGIGPNLVEVDAQFVPGNSGSPIIHLKSGKVIGVATYTVTRKYDATTHEKLATPEVRRYGYRLDNIKGWQAVNWQAFYAQADSMEKVHVLTGDLIDFLDDLAENKGKVNPSRHGNPVIRDRIAQWLEEKSGGHSIADQREANTNFLSFLKVACQSDISTLQGRLTYDYFQRELRDEQQDRTQIATAFSQIISDVGKE